MANTDTPRGFTPFGETLHVGYYAVPTAPTINICVGDIVIEDVTNIISKKLGVGVAVYDAAVVPATTGNDRLVLGAVVGVFDHHMNAIQYLAPGTVGDATVAGYVAVADDPNQQFLAQASTAVATADFELNYEIGSATLSAPDARTGLSTQEITITGANVTDTIPIRLVRQITTDDVASAAGCRFVCQINPLCHRYGAGTTI